MLEQAIRSAAALMGCKHHSDPPNAQGWISVGCPYAPFKHESGADRNPSMRVHVSEGGISQWKCWSCGKGGNLVSMIYELKMLGAEYPWAQLMDLATGEADGLVFPTFVDGPPPEPPPILPEDWLKTMPVMPPLCIGADYLRGRGYTEEDWTPWDTRWDPSGQRVCWPIRDNEGNLRGVQGRAIHANQQPKYLHYKYEEQARGSEFFLGEHRLNFDKPIVIVEGAIDGFGVSQVYPNVAIIMGASTILRPEKLDRLAMAFAVVPFLDGNKAGQLGMDTITKWCNKKRLCVPVYAPAGKDPGNLGEETIGELLGEALAQISTFV